MALGADRGKVLALILSKALLLVALGLAIGIPVALLGGTPDEKPALRRPRLRPVNDDRAQF